MLEWWKKGTILRVLLSSLTAKPEISAKPGISESYSKSYVDILLLLNPC
ncbi:MAG: hypothetical protein LBF22_01965 [Deltaproteobacteria bacterium]|nr:hypothetical protein [Deltaproteobacteria bacterium]